MTLAMETTDARTLVDPELFGRLTRKIAQDKDVPVKYAERIMDQALAFLGACAAYPSSSLSPSPTVDVGWHVFILYTLDYAEFCERVAGRFIHHVPEDVPDAPEHAISPVSVRDVTVDTIRHAGYTVDGELWSDGIYAHSCGTCHEHGNCGASGTTGDENKDNRTPPHH